MPSRDGTGRRLGGAEQKKAAADRAAAAEEAQTARERAGMLHPPKRQPLSYDDLPPPPLDDSAAMVTWGNKVVAVVMDQAMLDPFITEESRRRTLLDGAAKLGMIRDKAAEQERIRAQLQKMKDAEAHQGMENAKDLPPATPAARPE